MGGHAVSARRGQQKLRADRIPVFGLRRRSLQRRLAHNTGSDRAASERLPATGGCAARRARARGGTPRWRPPAFAAHVRWLAARSLLSREVSFIRAWFPRPLWEEHRSRHGHWPHGAAGRWAQQLRQVGGPSNSNCRSKGGPRPPSPEQRPLSAPSFSHPMSHPRSTTLSTTIDVDQSKRD